MQVCVCVFVRVCVCVCVCLCVGKWKLVQSDLDTTGSVGFKPSHRVVTEAQIRIIVLYYCPNSFSFTQCAKTWDTLK